MWTMHCNTNLGTRSIWNLWLGLRTGKSDDNGPTEWRRSRHEPRGQTMNPVGNRHLLIQGYKLGKTLQRWPRPGGGRGKPGAWYKASELRHLLGAGPRPGFLRQSRNFYCCRISNTESPTQSRLVFCQGLSPRQQFNRVGELIPEIVRSEARLEPRRRLRWQRLYVVCCSTQTMLVNHCTSLVSSASFSILSVSLVSSVFWGHVLPVLSETWSSCPFYSKFWWWVVTPCDHPTYDPKGGLNGMSGRGGTNEVPSKESTCITTGDDELYV